MDLMIDPRTLEYERKLAEAKNPPAPWYEKWLQILREFSDRHLMPIIGEHITPKCQAFLMRVEDFDDPEKLEEFMERTKHIKQWTMVDYFPMRRAFLFFYDPARPKTRLINLSYFYKEHYSEELRRWD